MAYSRPGIYPQPHDLKDSKGVEVYLKRLIAALQDNDRTGEQLRDRAPSKDLKALMVRPEWYGAKGDGVTDDTTAIQAAINAAGAKSVGRCVLFGSAPTYYRCASSLTVNHSFITLLGLGYSGIVFDGDGFIISSAVHDVTFDGLIINGHVTTGTTGGIGIDVQAAVSHLTVRGCYMERWGTYGDATGAAIKIGADCVNMNISENTFSVNGRGLWVASTVDDAWVCHNVFGQEAGKETDWAIYITGSIDSVAMNIISNNCVVSGGFISAGWHTAVGENYAGGINILYNEYEALATNPDVTNTKTDGSTSINAVIYLGIGTGYNVVGNYVGLHDNGDYCIYVESFVTGMGVNLIDNIMDGANTDGIYIASTDVNSGFFANNRMLNSTDNATILYSNMTDKRILWFDQDIRTTASPMFGTVYVASTTEKVTDGGMETWASATNLTNWIETTSGSGTVNRDDAEEHGGTYCARIDVDSGNNGASISQAVTLTASLPHKLTFWYKTTGTATARLLFNDDGGNVYMNTSGQFQAGAVYIELAAAATWTEYEITFTTHASYTNYVIALMSYTATSESVYFDDVSIIPKIAIGGANTVVEQSVTTTSAPTFDHVHANYFQAGDGTIQNVISYSGSDAVVGTLSNHKVSIWSNGGEKASVSTAGVVDATGSYSVDGTQVVSNRVVDSDFSITPNSGDSDTDTLIDKIRDALITHGLIAAS